MHEIFLLYRVQPLLEVRPEVFRQRLMREPSYDSDATHWTFEAVGLPEFVWFVAGNPAGASTPNGPELPLHLQQILC